MKEPLQNSSAAAGEPPLPKYRLEYCFLKLPPAALRTQVLPGFPFQVLVFPQGGPVDFLIQQPEQAVPFGEMPEYD